MSRVLIVPQRAPTHLGRNSGLYLCKNKVHTGNQSCHSQNPVHKCVNTSLLPTTPVRARRIVASAGRGNSIVQSPSNGDRQLNVDLPAGVMYLLAALAAVHMLTYYPSYEGLVTALSMKTTTAAWWHFIASPLYHAGTVHLLRTAFLLSFFGRMLRKEVGSGGVWFTYLLCGLGANISAWVLIPHALRDSIMVGIGATGASAGVAAAALLLSARMTFGWLAGAAVAAAYVAYTLIDNPVPGSTWLALEATMRNKWGLKTLVDGMSYQGLRVPESMSFAGMSWVWGALLGAVLVVLLARLPMSES